jgi:endonuclease/exonuclease/phosphatase family metal-dependent hydrolase
MSAALAGGLQVNLADADPAIAAVCRALPPARHAAEVSVRWIRPDGAAQRRVLDRWCGAVGPVVTSAAPGSPLVSPERLDAHDAGLRAPDPAPGGAAAAAVDELRVVTWNVHVGGGDVDALVSALRSGALTNGRPVRQFVLLLQEVHRGSAAVPAAVRAGLGFASAIQPLPDGRSREDIVRVARRLGLHLYYVPSMRNGAPGLTDEDRGNAILSTLPLTDLLAVELPFERQRRVAVAATVRGRSSSGAPWRLAVASVHLDTAGGFRDGWLFSGAVRQRQIRAFLDALPSDRPAIVGGDLNTLFGYRDPAYLEAASRLPDSPTADRRPTFAGLLRLDHLFFNLPDGWAARSNRVDRRFGSDHHPVIGSVRLPVATAPAS